MIIDKGFSHMLAKKVLENDPDNREAKEMLLTPKNKIISDGKVYNLDQVDEVELRKTIIRKKLGGN